MPHVTLKCIANNPGIKEVTIRQQAQQDRRAFNFPLRRLARIPQTFQPLAFICRNHQRRPPCLSRHHH
ncbi:MAG: hypothetical protein ACREXS_11515, partial [Gammaproteobacteria bacterium]